MSETSMKYLRLDNHTVWPAPQSTWDLEHALRYSTSTGLTPEERLFLASVLAAYRQCCPPKVRKHPDNHPAARGAVPDPRARFESLFVEAALKMKGKTKP